jgi:hypothetical protein
MPPQSDPSRREKLTTEKELTCRRDLDCPPRSTKSLKLPANNRILNNLQARSQSPPRSASPPEPSGRSLPGLSEPGKMAGVTGGLAAGQRRSSEASTACIPPVGESAPARRLWCAIWCGGRDSSGSHGSACARAGPFLAASGKGHTLGFEKQRQGGIRKPLNPAMMVRKMV